MIRALIVDDEQPARDRLRLLLHEIGVQIVGEADDGERAIEQIDALAPDLVFLDIQMPALSGLEVAARLTAPRPRIVFCTAFDQFAVDAFEHHAVDYLLKPVNRDRLGRTVTRVAAQIEEQRHRTRERDEAVRTQARLMPGGAARTAGFDCGGACRPAEGVGGDYYDFLELAEGRLGAAVGDVSGKGMYAGLLAAAIQARMQAITAAGVHAPGAVLAEINRLTLGTIDTNRFVTVFFGVFDRDAGTLTYASAGHPPALLVRRDGRTSRLEATGPVIGWSADARFEQHAVALAAGDLVVAYSDGLTETCDAAGAELGTDGLAVIVRRRASAEAARVALDVLADVDRFGGGAPAADDRTLIAVRAAEARG